jgi:hypothetical protein
MAAVLSRNDIDFSLARPVITAAQKFVIPVAALSDADPLVYPAGSPHAGQPIKDWEGKPVGDTGIIFFNRVDQCYQAVPANGRSVIIINEVTGEHARSIETFIGILGESIDDLSKASLERLLAHLRDRMSLYDVYNSTDEFIRANMIPLRPPLCSGTRPSGWMRRDDRGSYRAVFVSGPGYFAGPAATPQRIQPHGAFIVAQDSSCHMVDAPVMVRTYRNLDGSPLELCDFIQQRITRSRPARDSGSSSSPR